MNIGQAIRTLRTKQDMTQTELAERTGVSVNTVSAWELGKTQPPRDRITRLCVALGIPASYLMMESIEESDIPEDKRALYRTLFETVKSLLIDDKPAEDKK